MSLNCSTELQSDGPTVALARSLISQNFLQIFKSLFKEEKITSEEQTICGTGSLKCLGSSSHKLNILPKYFFSLRVLKNSVSGLNSGHSCGLRNTKSQYYLLCVNLKWNLGVNNSFRRKDTPARSPIASYFHVATDYLSSLQFLPWLPSQPIS